ncbi:hypothetical protein E2C01_102847 [Portunus trituberculatus]|uniref:Uncharacterized protein n=1 Tax=Portunus trituberculatus TaxID=210409 RepID=A0A5B7KJH2_PORTR|nr:hypothetical protein [Portunus trituberculatus]
MEVTRYRHSEIGGADLSHCMGTPANELKGIYITFILPTLMYVSPVWSSSLTCTQQQQMEDVQTRAWRIILSPAYTNYVHALPTLISPHWLSNTERASSGWVACCATHGYDTFPPTRTSQPMPQVTQTWSRHLKPRGPNVTNTVRAINN